MADSSKSADALASGNQVDALNELAFLIERVQQISKELWGDEYLDCDCGHDTDTCKCDCYMCEKGWKLTEYLELHSWEVKLLPLVTSRDVQQAVNDLVATDTDATRSPSNPPISPLTQQGEE